MRYLLFFVLACFISSCQPSINTTVKKTYPALRSAQPVPMILLKVMYPASAEEVGEVAVTDGGFTSNCSWDTVVAKAMGEARRLGGNVVKIIYHSEPSLLGSSCHQITAKILREDSVYSAKIASGEI